MAVRRSPRDLGLQDAKGLATAIGADLRSARIALGLSQAFVAKVVRVSPSALGRIERGEVRNPDLRKSCCVARALGQKISIKLYPAGSPVRDAAQLGALARLEAVAAAPINHRREAVLPGEGELRAWDDLLTTDDRAAFVDAESRIGDVQELQRRLEGKLRDDPRSQVLILVVSRTRHNLAVLAEHREALRPLLPLDGAAIIRDLRAGRLPRASGIVVI